MSKATPEQAAEFRRLAELISEGVRHFASQDHLAVPALAICSFLAFQRLQAGNEEEQRAAQVWLRGMWDNLDLAVLQPAFKCKECRKQLTASAQANYLVLEGYFSGYGNVEKDLKRLRALAAKEGLAPNGGLNEVVESLVRLVTGVTKVGGRVLG